MKAKSEYIRSFAGKETPLVFLCPAGFSEEEEKLEEQLEKNGFRLVARLTGIPSADGLQRFSFAASQSAVQRRMESEKNTCICGCIIV